MAIDFGRAIQGIATGAMRQFKPLKGQKHCKAKTKAEKARKKEQRS